ncbi:uncharacterized protein LOC127178904 [Labeo rohita]|uniref:uncharacterized protein LOC127178904 n=1 Tax=Labeo rohita TaxID=84645 RepID=UPI0021E2F5A3|nr:uncharacterized protein LOC127178904 [Labeo rohita]
MQQNAKLLQAFAFINGSQWDEKWYRLGESPLHRTLHDDYRQEKKYARINAANERLNDAATTMSTTKPCQCLLEATTHGFADLMEEEESAAPVLCYLNSQSGGTYSLQRIHWRASDIMLNFYKSVVLKRKAHLQSGQLARWGPAWWICALGTRQRHPRPLPLLRAVPLKRTHCLGISPACSIYEFCKANSFFWPLVSTMFGTILMW